MQGRAKSRIVLLGPPGSGKGTQAARLAERMVVPAISTGDMLRTAVAAGSDLGRRVKAIMAEGSLVDDATMAEVVRERLAQTDAVPGFILDGYPRTVRQAEVLNEILAQHGTGRLEGVVLIEVPEEELVARALSRRRADDREEVIRHRLEVYRLQTQPLADYYEERGLLLRVDGFRSIDEVSEDLMTVLGGTD